MIDDRNVYLFQAHSFIHSCNSKCGLVLSLTLNYRSEIQLPIPSFLVKKGGSTVDVFPFQETCSFYKETAALPKRKLNL